jgi:hypothetical protein
MHTVDGQLVSHASLARFRGVTTRGQLIRLGMTFQRIEDQVQAARWRVVGRAVVLHNGSLTVPQQRRIALITHGRSVLSSFTAAEVTGLKGWDCGTIYLLAPPRTRRFTTSYFPT